MEMLRQSAVLLLCASFILGHPENRPVQSGAQPPRVTTPLGEIEGAVLRTRLGKPIYAFRGIRYAKPPINELRFKPPVPIEKWENVLNATTDGPLCPQVTTDPISEDCLILNVYSTKLPKANENPKRPVIFYIHAGNFESGSSASYIAGPQYLLDQDVVLVTFNYRLGALGFLSTADKESPGNYGLRDQVEALKFVKNNIASFGGDPESITILGYHAGGISVTLHMLSPLSQGLFHRAIAMSGSIFTPVPLILNQTTLAKKQARLLSCPDDTSANIIKCLKTKTVDEFVNTIPAMKEFGDNPEIIWMPAVEGKDFPPPLILHNHPVQILNNENFTKVPLLVGVPADGFGYKAFKLVSNASLLEALDKQFEKYAPIVFQYERNTETSRLASKDFRKFYFGSKSIDNSSLPQLAQFFADALTGISVNRGARLFAEKMKEKPIYYYKFSYKGRYSHFYLPDSNGTVPYGVVHEDDLMYLLFNSKLFPEFKPNDPESQTVEKMTTLWANFAKTGNPIPEQTEKLDNVKWEPFTKKHQAYLDIGNKLVMVTNEKLFEKRYHQWDVYYPQTLFYKTTPPTSAALSKAT